MRSGALEKRGMWRSTGEGKVEEESTELHIKEEDPCSPGRAGVSWMMADADSNSCVVSLADRFIGNIAAKDIPRLLEENPATETLDLRGNHIKEEGIIALARTMPKLSHLKV